MNNEPTAKSTKLQIKFKLSLITVDVCKVINKEIYNQMNLINII